MTKLGFVWILIYRASVLGCSVQLPVRQPWPPTVCHTGNARPGMGPSCCLPNLANLFLNQTSHFKDDNNKNLHPSMNCCETRDQLFYTTNRMAISREEKYCGNNSHERR